MTTLNEIFDFTPEELVINEHGKLSARQAALLKREENDENISLIFGLSIIGILTLVICGICAALYNIPVILQSISGLVIGFGAFAGVLLIAVLLVNWQGARERARQPKVSTVSGAVAFQATDGRSRTAYYLLVGDQTLPMTEMQYTGFQAFHRRQPPDAPYRFYYATHRRKILAADMVETLTEGEHD
ncbi:MAG: hypothetical protein OHK0046_50190 [Anaerolineae bacterium]